MNVTFTKAYIEQYPDLPFGIAYAWECDAQKGFKPLVEPKIQAKQDINRKLGEIKESIGLYEAFFKKQKRQSPLSFQLNGVLQKGFPSINPFVDILILSEMQNGVLMGIQDLDKISGDLAVDLAQKGEEFEGFKNRIRCRKGEIVLRDAESIVASYFQGPDKKTSISPKTRNVILYAFFVPGIEKKCIQQALEQAVWLLNLYSTEKKSMIKIFEPNTQ